MSDFKTFRDNRWVEWIYLEECRAVAVRRILWVHVAGDSSPATTLRGVGEDLKAAADKDGYRIVPVDRFMGAMSVHIRQGRELRSNWYHLREVDRIRREIHPPFLQTELSARQLKNWMGGLDPAMSEHIEAADVLKEVAKVALEEVDRYEGRQLKFFAVPYVNAVAVHTGVWRCVRKVTNIESFDPPVPDKVFITTLRSRRLRLIPKHIFLYAMRAYLRAKSSDFARDKLTIAIRKRIDPDFTLEKAATAENDRQALLNKEGTGWFMLPTKVAVAVQRKWWLDNVKCAGAEVVNHASDSVERLAEQQDVWLVEPQYFCERVEWATREWHEGTRDAVLRQIRREVDPTFKPNNVNEEESMNPEDGSQAYNDTIAAIRAEIADNQGNYYFRVRAVAGDHVACTVPAWEAMRSGQAWKTTLAFEVRNAIHEKDGYLLIPRYTFLLAIEAHYAGIDTRRNRVTMADVRKRIGELDDLRKDDQATVDGTDASITPVPATDKAYNDLPRVGRAIHGGNEQELRAQLRPRGEVPYAGDCEPDNIRFFMRPYDGEFLLEAWRNKTGVGVCTYDNHPPQCREISHWAVPVSWIKAQPWAEMALDMGSKTPSSEINWVASVPNPLSPIVP